MQTNNELYQLALSKIKSNGLVLKNQSDAQKLRSIGYVVSKIDIDSDLPPTPTLTGFVENKEIELSALNLVSYCLSLGIYPVVYEGENEGKLLRHVVPKQGLENQISSYGSNETFFPHVDNPDLRLREEDMFNDVPTYIPDTLTLLCLKQQEGVATSILLLSDVLKDLVEEEISLLEERKFIIKRPASFSGETEVRDVPLLMKGKDGSYISRFDYHNIDTESPKHKVVLEKFKKSAIDQDKWISLYLRPGEIVTFDNQKTLHTRNGFKAKFDGNDRWLIRLFGTYDKPLKEYFVSSECNHHLRTK